MLNGLLEALEALDELARDDSLPDELAAELSRVAGIMRQHNCARTIGSKCAGVSTVKKAQASRRNLELAREKRRELKLLDRLDR